VYKTYVVFPIQCVKEWETFTEFQTIRSGIEYFYCWNPCLVFSKLIAKINI